MIQKDYNIDNMKANIDLVKNIINNYEEMKLSIMQIALMYNLTLHTVRTILLDNKVIIRGKNNRQ